MNNLGKWKLVAVSRDEVLDMSILGKILSSIWKTSMTNPNEGFVKIISIGVSRNIVSFCSCDFDGKAYGQIYTQNLSVFLDWHYLLVKNSNVSRDNSIITDNDGFATGDA